MKTYTNLFNLQTLSNAFHLVGGEIHYQIAPIYNNALVSSPNPFVVSSSLSCVLQTMLDFLHDNKINPCISHPPLGPFSIDVFCPFACFHALEIVPFTMQAFGLPFNGVANVAFDTIHSINFHPFCPW